MVCRAANGAVVDEDAVGDIADLTSDNGIGTHRLLRKGHMQLTELTQLSLAAGAAFSFGSITIKD